MTLEAGALKETLEHKQAELVKAIRSHSSQLSLDESENELIDRVQAMSRREESVALLNALTRTLTQVHCALDAVKNGAYGECEECGEPISPRRLNAIPWASHCIRCQEVLDRRWRNRLDAIGWDEAA